MLRIATQNVWALEGDWPKRRKVLAQGFAALAPDVVALQETIVSDEMDQAREIFGDSYNLLHQKSGRAEGLGISIASRWPIRLIDELDLHVTARTTARFPCAALIAQIQAPNPIGPFIFANHFPNPGLDVEYERELQTVMVARALETLATESDEKQIIVAGDLDADPASASLRFWTGRQSSDGTSVCYRDVWESSHPDDAGHTFTPEHPLVKHQRFRGVQAFIDWPFRRIDYILLRFGSTCGRALQVHSCTKIFTEAVDGVWASDHFGVMAELGPPPS